MNSWFQLAICIVLQLGLLNFAFPVVSSCVLTGSIVHQTGDQIRLECNGEVDDLKISTLDGTVIKPSNRTTVHVGRPTTVTIDKATLNDSRVYRCQCNTDHSDWHVFVFKANMHVTTNNETCETAIRLKLTVKQKDFGHFNLSAFSCPTLGRGDPKIWEFPSVTNHLGDHVIHVFAAGKSGDVGSQTCHFTAVYRPNGTPHPRNFTMTVEETRCVKEITAEVKAHTGTIGDLPTASEHVSRAAQCNLQLTALLLLLLPLLTKFLL